MTNVRCAQRDQYHFLRLDAFMRTAEEVIGLPPLDIPQPKNRTSENPPRIRQPRKRLAIKLRHFIGLNSERLWQVITEWLD